MLLASSMLALALSVAPTATVHPALPVTPASLLAMASPVLPQQGGGLGNPETMVPQVPSLPAGPVSPPDPRAPIVELTGDTPELGITFAEADGNFGQTLLFEKDGISVFAGPFRWPFDGPPPVDLPEGLIEIFIDVANTPTAFPERFLFQAPGTLEVGERRPLLMAFHSFASGPQELITKTDFAREARGRGWFFLAPHGAADENFSSIPSQLNTELVVDMVMAHFGKYIDTERIYGVGFSMGGNSALNYAARHIDTTEPMFAAVVNHTGGLALRSSYDNGTVGTRAILEFWFGGGPISNAFEYRRSSVIDYTLGTLTVFPDESLGNNLTHVPILSVRAEFEPLAYLIQQNSIFETFMAGIGGQVTTDIKTGVSVHEWATLDEVEALEFLEQHRLELPTSARTLADGDRRVFYFDVVQDASGAFTPFDWDLDTRANQLSVTDAQNLMSMAASPIEMGLSYARPQKFVLGSGDATTDLFIVKDFPDAPVEVLLDGISTASWTHDPVTQRLTLTDTDPAVNTWEVFAPQATANLGIVLQLDNAAPLEDEQVTYTLTVENFGPVNATGVEITDLLPAGLIFRAAIPEKGSYASGTGIWTIGDLDFLESTSMILIADTQLGAGGATIINTASVSDVAQLDTVATNNSRSASLTVDNNADLSVTKLVDNALPEEGEQVVFTITLENVDPGARARNVSLTDLLPSGLTYVSDNPSQGSYVSGTGVWTVGTVDSGNTATLELTASVDGGTVGTMIVNTTSGLTADQPDPVSANDSDSASVLVVDDVDLSLTKVVDDATPNEQQQVVYTLTVSNSNATLTASSITIGDTLPAGVTFVSALESQGSYDDVSGIWTVGSIAALGNATLDITASVDVGAGGAMIVNSAFITNVDQPDPNGSNDADSAQIDVDPNADLGLVKVVDEAAPLESDQVVYTLTLSNPLGAAQATSVAVTDLLPAGVTYVSDVPSQGSYDDGTGIWTVGTVDASAGATLAITASVDVGTGGQAIVNTATITASDQPDPNGANDADTAQIDVDDQLDLSIAKVVDDDKPMVSDQVVFTITVANAPGGAQASNVSLTDLLPAGLTYVSDVPSQGAYVSGTGVWTIGTIDTGANATLDVTASVDGGTVGNTIVNTANGLALDQTDTNGTNDSDTASLLVVADIDLSIAKTVDDSTPIEQGTIVWTLTVTNTDASFGASNITVDDLLPAGVTYVSDVPSQGSYVSGTGVWSVGSIAALGTATLDITATVDAGTGGDAIINTATISGADQPDPNATNDSDTAQIDVENEADLSLTKVPDDATPTEQQNVVYTITVANPGGGARAENVSVTDLLPAGVTYVSDAPSQGTYDDGTGIWTVGDIDAGADATLDITAGVDVATAGTAIVNTASITALDQTDGNAANDSDTAQIDVEDEADLALTKIVDDAAPIEQGTVVYTVTVASPVGAAQATNVTVSDLLPAGVTYVSDVASQGSYDDGTGVWTVGTVDADSNATLDITVTVDVGTGGSAIVNSAVITALDQTDSNATNDSDNAQIDVSDEADLSVTKVVDVATPKESDTVVFTVAIANGASGARATGVVVTDLLPAGLTYVSDVPSQGSYVSGTGVWTVGTVDSGSNATLDVTATVDVGTGGTSIVNTATSTALDQTDSVPANDSDTAQVDVDDEADLSVTKLVDDLTPIEQGTVVYTITLENTAGGAQATNVTLTDLLPAGVTYVSDTPSQGSYVSGTGLWTVGTLDTGTSATLELTATVDAGTGGTVVANMASVAGLDQTDSTPANDTDQASITVDNETDLSVTKVVDEATPRVGDDVVFTLTVANAGGGAQAQNVTLTDLLPAGLTYVSDVPGQGSYVSGTGIWTVGTIDAGSNATLDITASVDAGQAGAAIVNTTTALGSDQTDTNGANDADSAQVDVEPDVDLSVAVVVDDAAPLEQGTVIYTVTVTNTDGTNAANSVEVTDLLPAGVTFVSDTPSQGSYVSGTGVWTVGTLAALGNATLDVTATVDVGTAGTAIVNTADITGTDRSDSNPGNDSDSVQIDVDDEADLGVAKIVDEATPKVGENVVYTLTVSNPGGGAQAENVSLTDLLPSGVTYVSDVPSQGSYVSGTGVWTVGTIAAGANATLDITASVDAGQEGVQITNLTSGLTADQTDSNATNDVGSIAIDVEEDVDLAVTLVVDDATPAEQDTVVYTLTVTNNDASDSATGISITDLLPSGVTYVSDNPSQGSYVSGTGVWTVGTIAALGNATLGITATVDVATGGDSIVNTTSGLAFDQTDATAGNDSDSVQIDVDDEADLGVVKIVDEATPKVGENVVYTLTVSNPGGGAQAENVSLTDLLPSGVTYVSDVPSQGSYVSGTGVWTVGTIAAGANATLDITASVDAGQEGVQITNLTSGLTADQTDSNATNDVGSIAIDVEEDVDLAVTVVVDDATPAEQDTVVYTLTVTNNDASDSATGISITDLLPSGVTYVSDNPSQGSYVSGTGVWTVGTIAALGNATLGITATVDVATGGDSIVNTTSGLAFDQTDATAGNDSDSVQIDVEDTADLAVAKIVDEATPKVGGTVVYTITVTNPGGGAQATNVSLTDALPSGVTYVSDTPSQGTYVSGTGVWTVGTINAGANATLDITATVDSGQEGVQITNTTSGLAADQTDGNATNDVGSIAIDVEEEVDLSVSLSVDDTTPKEQDTIVYTVTVTNNDSTDGATNVSVTDLLPSGVTYSSDNPSQGSFVSGTGVWTVGSIAASGNATLDITVTVDVGTGGDSIVNATSALSSDQTDGTSGNDTDSVQIDVDDDADLSVGKVVDDSTPDETDTIVYTITITNTSGGAQATNVSITDVLPSGVTYNSDNPSQGSFASGTGVWTVGTIDSGSNATLDITVTVDTSTSGQMITNSTSSLSLDQSDPVGANDTGSVTITVN